MRNFFENAKFGDIFFTRNGERVIFHKTDHTLAYLFSDTESFAVYVSTGLYDGRTANPKDIVEKLDTTDKLTKILAEGRALRDSADGRKVTGGWYWEKWVEYGYKKALEI